jgi:hypothetical protein
MYWNEVTLIRMLRVGGKDSYREVGLWQDFPRDWNWAGDWQTGG